MKCTKKVRCTCKVVVLPTKSIVVLDVLVAVASLDRKVPKIKSSTELNVPTLRCVSHYDR